MYGIRIDSCGSGWEAITASAKIVWGPHSFEWGVLV